MGTLASQQLEHQWIKSREEVLGPINLVVAAEDTWSIARKNRSPPVELPPVMVVSPDTSDLEPQIVDAELLEPDWQESSTAIVTIETTRSIRRLVWST